VVDAGQLAFDVVGTVVSVLLPWALWLLLFLWAWERPEEARRAGFGRRTFWLLLPVAALASLANTPLLDWSGSVLAMNAGGALLPLLLSAVLLYHAIPEDGRRTAAGFFLTAAGLSGALFLCLFLPVGTRGSAPPALHWLLAPAAPGGAANWVFLAVVALWPALVAVGSSSGVRSGAGGTDLRLAGLNALTGLGILFTFYSSESVPNEGIISTFPAYLFAPILLGLVAVLLAGPVFRLRVGAGISIAYATATVGVVVGADVLREPPLYNGAAAVLSIGGAGVSDLVYLSGLIAVATAFVGVWALGRGRPELWGAEVAREPRGPRELWRRGLILHTEGRYREALASAEAATHEAGEQLHRLGLGRPESEPGVWAEFGPAWLEPDRRNLAHLAESGSDDPADSSRGLLAARLFLDRAGSALRSRFAPLSRRCAAFGIDLLLLTAPALLLWVWLIERSANSSTLLTALPYSVAIYAYIAFGFLYFLIGDALGGSSVGKRLLGLRVRDRSLGTPGLIPAFVRDAPKLVPLVIVGEGGALGLALVLAPSSSPLAPLGPALSSATGVVLLLGAAFGVGLVGLLSVLTILSTPERQRIGDLWAGTWVVRASSATPVPPAALGTAPVASVPSAGAGSRSR
jgi:uncharacterized RDD family membrane protein YckC